MTIEQANAVNKVLRHLIERRTIHGHGPSPEEVVSASVLLADKAHKVLMAGLTGAEVREALS